jgi:hypothetical protein
MSYPPPHTSERLYCTYELKNMSWDDWLAIPITEIEVSHLTPTQGGLSIDRLIAIAAGNPREGEDPYGHAISYQGKLYIHDGHHDWALRWIKGEQRIPMRIKQIDNACINPCCH